MRAAMGGLVVLAGIAGCGRGPVPQGERPAGVRATRTWAAPGEAVAAGDVEVRLAGITLGRPRLGLSGSKETFLLDGPKLLVSLVVSNRSETRKLDYRSWSAAILPGFRPRLGDEYGNEYGCFELPRLVGSTGSGASIYPGKEAADVLAFEPPVAKASEFRLLLPGAAVGAEEPLRFRFSRADIRPGERVTGPRPRE